LWIKNVLPKSQPSIPSQKTHITKKGKKQMQEMGFWVIGVSFDYIITLPLSLAIGICSSLIVFLAKHSKILWFDCV